MKPDAKEGYVTVATYPLKDAHAAITPESKAVSLGALKTPAASLDYPLYRADLRAPGRSVMRALPPFSASRVETLRRLAWRLETPRGLIALFGVAFLVRLLIAPHAGFWGDIDDYRQWAVRLEEAGIRGFYEAGAPAEYPPGYLYLLWLVGKLSASPGYLLLKLPALLADIGLALIAGTFAARLAPSTVKERWPVRALVAAAVLFNPAVLALGAVWGQVDSVTAMFVLWSLLLLFAAPPMLRYEIPAFLLFAVAISTKPQSAFVFPVMLYALYRRHLYHRDLSDAIDGVLRIMLIGVLSLGTWLISGLPFGLGPISIVRFNGASAENHAITSANAFNLWGAVGFWRNDSAGDNVVAVAGIPAVWIGLLLFLAGTAYVLWQTHRAITRGAQDATALTIAAATVALLAFALLTRMHERYMFLALAVFAPLVFLRPLRFVYAGLSGLFVLNLWYPFAFYNTQRWHVQGFHFDPWFTWLFGGFVTDTWQKKVWSLTVVTVAILVAWRGARWAKLLAPAGAPGAANPSALPPAADPGGLSR